MPPTLTHASLPPLSTSPTRQTHPKSIMHININSVLYIHGFEKFATCIHHHGTTQRIFTASDFLCALHVHVLPFVSSLFQTFHSLYAPSLCPFIYVSVVFGKITRKTISFIPVNYFYHLFLNPLLVCTTQELCPLISCPLNART